MNKKKLYALFILLALLVILMAAMSPGRSTANPQTNTQPLFLPLIMKSDEKSILDPYLVKDINLDISAKAPYCGAVLGNDFICYRQIDGVESIWKTDGTQEGTSKVKDVFAYRLDDKWMLNYKDIVYFASGDGLWRTDGTELGTKLVNNEPSFGNITPSPQFTQAGDLFYFAARNNELWVSNGTEGGTKKIKKFTDDLQSLAAFKGEIYFSADDEAYDPALWKSDGTSEGTIMVKQIWPAPINLTVVGDLLFMGTESNGDLWVSDGTSEGTKLFATGVVHSSLAAFNGELLYWASGGFWSTDGTVEGTRRIVNAPAPYYVLVADSLVYFFPEIPRIPIELWRTDGTASGTFSLNTTLPEVTDERYFHRAVVALGDHLFFTKIDENSGGEPWTSDGTIAGTRLLADIVPGPDSSQPGNYKILGDKVYFVARTAIGDALWVSDGSGAGADQVVSIFYKDVHRSGPVDLTSVSGRLFFAANDGLHGDELWASNGTDAGTYLVKDINSGSEGSGTLGGYPGGAALNNDLIFSAAGGVWKSDGSQAGTNLLWKWDDHGVSSYWGADSLVYIFDSGKLWVTDGRPGNPKLLAAFDGFSPKQVVNGDRIYLYLYEEGIESLWTSMGTSSSTIKLYSGPVTGLCIFNALAYFSTGNQIWQSDPTSGDTMVSVTIPDGKIEDLAAAGSNLYFAVSNDEGWSLWRSDGSQEGTEFIKMVNSATDNEYIYTLHAFGEKVFFAANDGIHGFEPWISDGTPKGTMLVSDIAAGEESSYPDWITPTDNLVFFAANDGTHGVELWASDGKAQGTFMIEDIVPPGEGGLHYCPGDGSCPGYLTVAGNKLFFAAEEGDGDVELWALNLDK